MVTLWSARSLARIDSTMQGGTAVDAYVKLLDVASTDKERYKSYGIEASGYLAGYYNNVKKDVDAAIVYLEKGLEFDPENNALKTNLQILKKSASKPSSSTKSSPSSKSK